MEFGLDEKEPASHRAVSSSYAVSSSMNPCFKFWQNVGSSAPENKSYYKIFSSVSSSASYPVNWESERLGIFLHIFIFPSFLVIEISLDLISPISSKKHPPFPSLYNSLRIPCPNSSAMIESISLACIGTSIVYLI